MKGSVRGFTTNYGRLRIGAQLGHETNPETMKNWRLSLPIEGETRKSNHFTRHLSEFALLLNANLRVLKRSFPLMSNTLLACLFFQPSMPTSSQLFVDSQISTPGSWRDDSSVDDSKKKFRVEESSS
jgi:hypothetical protein